jgi:hypothetical protein
LTFQTRITINLHYKIFGRHTDSGFCVFTRNGDVRTESAGIWNQGRSVLVSSAWKGKTNIMTMGWHMMLRLVNGFFVISDAGDARLAERE